MLKCFTKYWLTEKRYMVCTDANILHITSLKASKLVRVFRKRTSYMYTFFLSSFTSNADVVPCHFYVCNRLPRRHKTNSKPKQQKNSLKFVCSIWYPLHFEWVEIEKAKFSRHPHSNNTNLLWNAAYQNTLTAYRIWNVRSVGHDEMLYIQHCIIGTYIYRINGCGFVRIWENEKNALFSTIQMK